jgi:hypothetical protein
LKVARLSYQTEHRNGDGNPQCSGPVQCPLERDKDIVVASQTKNDQDANKDRTEVRSSTSSNPRLCQHLLRESASQQTMINARPDRGNLSQIGADAAAKTVMSVSPDDPLVQAEQVATDPMNYLMAGAEPVLAKTFAGTIKPAPERSDSPKRQSGRRHRRPFSNHRYPEPILKRY